MPSLLEQINSSPRSAVQVYSPGRLVPGTAARSRPVPADTRQLFAQIAEESRRRSSFPMGSLQHQQATAGQNPWAGLDESIRSSAAYKPNVDAAKAAAEDALPWWKQGLGMVFGNPVVKAALGPVGALGTLGRAGTLVLSELAPHLPESVKNQAGPLIGNLLQGVDPARVEADKRSNLSKVFNPYSTYGYGDVVYRSGGDSSLRNRLLGLAGDVATDPLAWSTFGTSRVAETALPLEQAARATEVAERTRLADLATEAVDRARSQGNLLGAHRAQIAADVAESNVGLAEEALRQTPTARVTEHMTPGTKARLALIAEKSRSDISFFDRYASELPKVAERGFAYASPAMREELGLTAPAMHALGAKVPFTEGLGTAIGKATGAARAGFHEIPGLGRIGEIRAPAGAEEEFRSLAMGKGGMEPLRAFTQLQTGQLLKGGRVVEAEANAELRRTMRIIRGSRGARVSDDAIRQLVHEAETVPGKANPFREYFQKVLGIYRNATGREILPENLLDKETYVPHLLTRDWKRFLQANKQDRRVIDLMKANGILADDLLQGSPLLERSRKLRPVKLGTPTDFKIGGETITLTDGSIRELNEEMTRVFPEFKGKAYLDDPVDIGGAYASSLGQGAGAEIARTAMARSQNPYFEEVAGPMAEALRKRNEALLRSNPVTNYLRERPFRQGEALPDIGTAADVPASEYDQYFGNTKARVATKEAKDETMKLGKQLTGDVKAETGAVQAAAVKDMMTIRNQLMDAFDDRIKDRRATLKKLDPHIRSLIKQVEGLPNKAKAGDLAEVVSVLAQVTALRTKLDATLRSARGRWSWVIKKEEASGRAQLEKAARLLRKAEKDARDSLASLPVRMRAEAEERLTRLNAPVEQAQKELDNARTAAEATRAGTHQRVAEAHVAFRTSFKDSKEYAEAMQRYAEALRQVQVTRDAQGKITPQSVEAVENLATTPEVAESAATAVAAAQASAEVAAAAPSVEAAVEAAAPPPPPPPPPAPRRLYPPEWSPSDIDLFEAKMTKLRERLTQATTDAERTKIQAQLDRGNQIAQVELQRPPVSPPPLPNVKREFPAAPAAPAGPAPTRAPVIPGLPTDQRMYPLSWSPMEHDAFDAKMDQLKEQLAKATTDDERAAIQQQINIGENIAPFPGQILPDVSAPAAGPAVPAPPPVETAPTTVLPGQQGVPHHIPSPDHPGQYEVFDETGQSLGLSSKEQADRYVTRRKGIIKAMATRRRNAAKAAQEAAEVAPPEVVREIVAAGPPYQGQFDFEGVGPAVEQAAGESVGAGPAVAAAAEEPLTNVEVRAQREAAQVKGPVLGKPKELPPPRQPRKPFQAKWQPRRDKGRARYLTTDFLEDENGTILNGWKIDESATRFIPVNQYDSLHGRTYKTLPEAKKAIDDLIERRLQALEGYQGESLTVPLRTEVPEQARGPAVQRAVAVLPGRPKPPPLRQWLAGEEELTIGGQRPLLPSKEEAGAIPIKDLPPRMGISRDAKGNVVGTGYDADWQRMQDLLVKLNDPTYRRVSWEIQRQYDELDAKFSTGGKYARQRRMRQTIIEDLANQRRIDESLAEPQAKLARAEAKRAQQVESIAYLRQGEGPQDWIRLTEPTQGWEVPGERKAIPVRPPRGEVPTPNAGMTAAGHEPVQVTEELPRGQRATTKRQRQMSSLNREVETLRNRLDDVLNPVDPKVRPQLEAVLADKQAKRQELFTEMIDVGEAGTMGSRAVLNPRAVDRLPAERRSEFLQLQEDFDARQRRLADPKLTNNEYRRIVGEMNSIRLTQQNLLDYVQRWPKELLAEDIDPWKSLVSERPDPVGQVSKRDERGFPVSPAAQPQAGELQGNAALNQAYVDSLSQTPKNPERVIAERRAGQLAEAFGKEDIAPFLPEGHEQIPRRVQVTPKTEKEAIDKLLVAAEQTNGRLTNTADRAAADARVYENELLANKPQADALEKHAAARDAELVPLGKQAKLAKDLEDALTAKQFLIEDRDRLIRESAASITPSPGGKWTKLPELQDTSQAILALAQANPDMLDVPLNMAEAMLHNAHEDITRVLANRGPVDEVQAMMKLIQHKDFPDVVLTTAAKGWDMVRRSQKGKGLLKEGDILIERQMHEAFNRLYQMKNEAKIVPRVFGALTNLFKTYATLSPGFHVRNALSAIFMNTADGVALRTQLDGVKLWSRYMKEDGIEWLRQQPTEIQQAFQATFMSGAGGRYMEAGFAQGRGRMERAINNKVTRFSQRAGQRVEGSVRLGMALDSMRAGDTVEGAYNRIARVHFDYADVSKFDETAKAFIPFWTFMSRNLPLQVSEMYMRPGMYRRYAAFVKNFSTIDEQYTPEYWKQAGAFNTGLHIPNIPGMGGAQGLPVYLQPEVGGYQMNQQMADLVEGLSGKNFGALLSQANPWMTAPLEFGIGQNFFTGQKYQNTDYSDVGGVMTPVKWLATAFGQTNKIGQVSDKFLNSIQAVNPMMDRTARIAPQITGGGEEARKRQLESIARFIGVPIRTLTPKQQDNEYWRRFYEKLDQHKADLAMQKALAARG